MYIYAYKNTNKIQQAGAQDGAACVPVAPAYTAGRSTQQAGAQGTHAAPSAPAAWAYVYIYVHICIQVQI
jgi:hypothetical protein